MTRNQAIYMSHLFIASEEFATSNKNKTELFGEIKYKSPLLFICIRVDTFFYKKYVTVFLHTFTYRRGKIKKTFKKL